MGRGDNKRTHKMRRRKSWRKKKERLKALITGAVPKRQKLKLGGGDGGSSATVRRSTGDSGK